MEIGLIEEYKAIMSALPDKVFVLTETGQYAAVLGGESSTYYHDSDFLKSFNLYDVLPKEKAIWFIERIRETLSANKLMVFEYSLSAADVDNIDPASGPKGVLRFEGRVSPLKSLRYGERAVVWVARNITQRYELEQQLIYQAEVDPLSEAYTRRKLMKCLEEALYNFQRYKEISSFILLDIDNFKKINDQHGHQAGDEVIRSIVKLCQPELRQTDVMGCLGGDEFGIVYRGHQLSALAFASRLNELVRTIACESEISVSIGISQFQETDDNIEQVYNRADNALYESKRKGKDISSVH